MFNPYMQYANMYAAPRSNTSSYIRILHAVPGAPDVDVYANEKLLSRNISYREFTEYLSVLPGNYNISIYKAGDTTDPLITGKVLLEPGEIYTAAAIGMPSSPELYVVNDIRQPVSPVNANLRFIHFSPDAPPVDLYLPTGPVLFRNVAYKQVTNYIPVIPGKYAVYVRPTGTAEPVLYVPNINILPGKNYSIYAIGLVNGKPELQVLIPLDGSSYIPR